MEYIDSEAESQISEVWALEKLVAGIIQKRKSSKAQNAVDKTVLEGVCGAPALHKTASQQLMYNYIDVLEMTAKRASLNVVFKEYCANSHGKVSPLQVTLGSVATRADEEVKQLERLFLV